MSDIKLVYFDLRGRGEAIRMTLEAAGQKYEEVRIPLSEWSKEKPKTPYGQLPYMVYKGKVYGQSNAIAAFFAKQFGMYGKTPLDTLRIDEVMGLWFDQMKTVASHRFPKSESEKPEILKKILEEDLPKFFSIHENLLKDGGSSGYYVNNALSLADIYVYDLQDNLLQLKEDALKDYPLMQKLRQNVEAHPKLKVYLANRKKTLF